jgi:DNA polymerase I
LSQHVSKDGRIHTSFNIAQAMTGRLSSGGGTINLQNIPRDGAYRQCFEAESLDKKFIILDFAGQEARLLAAIADCKALLQLYKSGGDIYRRVAATCKGITESQVSPEDRKFAKTIVLSIFYGMGPDKMLERCLIEEEKTRSTAKDPEAKPLVKIVKNFLYKYPKQPVQIPAPGGFQRRFADATAWGTYTAALNHPIQGAAAAINYEMCNMFYAQLPQGVELVNNIHDEIIVQVDTINAEATALKLHEIACEAVLRIVANCPYQSHNSYSYAPGKSLPDLVEVKIVNSWGDK